MNFKARVIAAAAPCIVCLVSALLAAPSWADELAKPAANSAAKPVAPPAATAPEAATLAGEPNVKRTVIEDGGSKVEELRVRGQTQSITVTPKVGGMKPYQIIGSSGSRDLLEAPDATRGATGKRVWQVLSF